LTNTSDESAAIQPDNVERFYKAPSHKEHVLKLLRDSGEEGARPYIPAFARELLEHLRDQSMPEEARKRSGYSNVRSAKLKDSDQVLLVRFDTYRDPMGYMAVDVLETPKSETAILAAMAVMAAKPVDTSQVHRISQLLEAPLQDSVYDQGMKTYTDLYEKSFEKGIILLSLSNPDRHTLTVLEYVVALLRYHRPGFDDLPWEEQWDLIEAACMHINEFLQSLRNLEAFLDYGAPKRKLTPPIKEPQRDVRAAILNDVDGLSHRQIGKLMGVSLPDTSKERGGHVTVKHMAQRGRHILEAAFGKEGWQEKARAMKAEKARWWSLSAEERGREAAAEAIALANDDISLEEARAYIDANPSYAEDFIELIEFERFHHDAAKGKEASYTFSLATFNWPRLHDRTGKARRARRSCSREREMVGGDLRSAPQTHPLSGDGGQRVDRLRGVADAASRPRRHPKDGRAGATRLAASHKALGAAGAR